MVFFEGSEKKIEVIFNPALPSLRRQPEALWHSLVGAAKAQVLSKVSNAHLDAYLLSESSLFVYDHYLVMITCGTTKLIDAVEFIVEKFGIAAIDAFFYQRKNEILPHAQHSHFLHDVEKLKNWFSGEAMRFGAEDEHHLFLFSTNKTYLPDASDHTMEVLMHGVDPKVMQVFKQGRPRDNEEIRDTSRISELIQGQVDDFVFSPMGYSLNAIDEKKYYTIHITPQKFGNYTSFETNAFKQEDQVAHTEKILGVFKPLYFDLILFNTAPTDQPKFANYQLKQTFSTQIRSGYSVQYFSFYYPQSQPQEPFRF